ncbi:MAG: D-aminoacyl-tRNA deacylase [Fibrobacterota bacterium]
MRAVLQRVSSAEVTVHGESVGAIDRGLLVYLAVHRDDPAEATGKTEWLLNKICGLRLFEDSTGKMDLSLHDICGDILIVSQFTLYGDCRKGRRPSWSRSAGPDAAEAVYHAFVAHAQKIAPGNVATGRYRTEMAVHSCNDGPVTLILEK